MIIKQAVIPKSAYTILGEVYEFYKRTNNDNQKE